ncbi:carboxypeptidase-like regulatory domain-containing protein [Micromonospora sp. KC723]|uniref:carboxypeptidase-like regulatory domain-containing protein n=1 Tax=Micromonospora sp. KC723 TaxID=2530381 RepID=UPI0010506241|nr:carboxypeptidase-like regulatory domain-containing protein [Micromonospora sp. KC723]TDB75937.1 carboxypeptidase regulatory-like domain-containing protein [Micromonospora sp. KC723]
MRSLRATGAALLAALATVTFLAGPAVADTAGYTGVVSGPDGAPVAGACLAVHTSPTDVVAEHCADAAGRYTIPSPPSGPTYRIRMHAPGFRTEWWYGAPDHLNADAVWFPTSELVERNVTLSRGSAGITGTITDEYGAAAAATVTVYGEDFHYEATAYTWDLGAGRFAFRHLPPGRYRISVSDNVRGYQWVPQKETREEARVLTLTDGETAVVNESFLPMGVVEARVTDAVTGLPVRRPCLSVLRTGGNDANACGENGLVRIPAVRPGDWKMSVGGGASYFGIDETEEYHRVTRGQVTRVWFVLEPGAAFATAIRDATTGEPVAGICVRLVRPKWGGQSARMHQYCSDGDGHLEVGPFAETEPGGWQLYAYQATNPYNPPAKRYGAQWITADGGSGDQRQALRVTLRAKETVTLPTVRMDPPGTITGTIRNASGAVVPGVCAYPFAFHPGQGASWGRNCANSEGRYTIEALGPYRWPVEFAPNANSGYAWQWSGDVADRFAATMTKVSPGDTATVDARLVTGGVLAGKVTDGAGVVDAGYVWTYNARTGDIASASYANITRDGTFSLRGHRSQDVYVEYANLERGCWYGVTGRNAAVVAVQAGATTTVSADMTRTCARTPLGTSQYRSGSATGGASR